MAFTVAIVGRPNVGKSTLFNRLVGRRMALVDDRPGVTRDRREGEAHLLGLDFRVIDTAGYEDEDPASLPGRMRRQTEAAVKQAVFRLRQRYQKRLREEVADTVATFGDVDQELRHLVAALRS